MKQNKATLTMKIYFWDPTHYEVKTKPKHNFNPYNGFVIPDGNEKKNLHFHSAGEFLKIVEKEYLKTIKNQKVTK